ncbi:hypothetical protein QE109_02675 [Fusibacter bizertensis]|uniref:Uncharacterized protein n=1 Tax=Fusibacter bizertensis TaxID=1488331 RepID=A0ABT6N9E2_9FIRM|nr:hypothetical protein [Fusibacter bizertensis]MDH8677033.1 hypothetical protein [Fusibacter bizertensis]
MKKWGVVIILVVLVVLIKVKMVNIEEAQSNYGGTIYVRKPTTDSNYIISDEMNLAKFDLKERLNNDINQIYTDSSNHIICIYLVYDTYYQKLELDYDTNLQVPFTLEVESGIEKIYYSFPEYETVRAITYKESDKVDFETEITSRSINRSKEAVGGEPKWRVFSQSKFEVNDEQITFRIYNAFENEEINENTESFGGYVFVLRVQ